MTPTAVVVSVGDELLAGRVLDTNAHWIASVLRARGVSVVRRVTVPDERGAIAEAVRDALRRAPIVVVGGRGARQALKSLKLDFELKRSKNHRGNSFRELANELGGDATSLGARMF